MIQTGEAGTTILSDSLKRSYDNRDKRKHTALKEKESTSMSTHEHAKGPVCTIIMPKRITDTHHYATEWVFSHCAQSFSTSLLETRLGRGMNKKGSQHKDLCYTEVFISVLHQFKVAFHMVNKSSCWPSNVLFNFLLHAYDHKASP